MEGNAVYPVLLTSKAQSELAASWQWYEERERGLGDRFSAAIKQTLKTIAGNPETFSIKHKHYREAKVPVFPFLIVYKINRRKQLIEIVSVFHTSRNPQTKY